MYRCDVYVGTNFPQQFPILRAPQMIAPGCTYMPQMNTYRLLATVSLCILILVAIYGAYNHLWYLSHTDQKVFVRKMDSMSEGAGAGGGGVSFRSIVDTVLRPVAAFLFVFIGYQRMVKGITRTILLPSSLLGRNKQQLGMFMKQARLPEHQRVMIDNRLDAVILIPKNNKRKAAEVQKPKGWLIYSNANGVCYEHILRYTMFLGTFLNRKVCVYNYRGVGYSQGSCQSAQDMVEDLAAVIDYLHREHLDEDGNDDFVLWGHSIGGAVSLLTAHHVKTHGKQRETKFKIVADRSFSDLEVVVEDKISEGPMAPVISGLLVSSLGFAVTIASVFGIGTHPLPSLQDTMSSTWLQALDFGRALVSGMACMWVAIRVSPVAAGGPGRPVNFPFLFGFMSQILLGDLWLRNWYELDSLPAFLFTSFGLAFEVASRGHFSLLLRRIVTSQGWVMNPGAIVKELIERNNKVIVTFHREDEMIPMKAGLAPLVDARNVLELEGPSSIPSGGAQANHMYELDLFELQRIRDLLDEDSPAGTNEDED